MKVWCGLDMSWRGCHACFVDRTGRVLASFPVSHERDSVTDLVSQLRLLSKNRREDVTIATEDPTALISVDLARRGYRVQHVLPRAAAHYRDAHNTGGSKSDASDAFLLAEMVRTEPRNHRPRPTYTPALLALRTFERAQQDAVWRRGRPLNRLRALLASYYPAATAAFRVLHAPYAITTLRLAPTPGAALSLRRATLARALVEVPLRHDTDRAATTILAALRAPHLRRESQVEEAMGKYALRLIDEVAATSASVDSLGAASLQCYMAHPHHKIYASFPALSGITGARLLGEIGDDPNRFDDAAGLLALAGTLPLTRQSGSAIVVRRRVAYNHRLGHAAHMWATPLVNASPAARARYEHRREVGDRYSAAARNLLNHYLRTLYLCVERGELYDEARAGEAVAR